MGRLSDALAAPGPIVNNVQAARKTYPDGWQPRSDVDDTTGGFVVSKPFSPDHQPEHGDVLDEFGLSPAQWHVTSVRRSRWQKYDGDWLESVRISIVPAKAVRSDQADLDALTGMIGKWRPTKTAGAAHTDFAGFVAPSGDTQIGKPDGDGTEGTIARFLSEVDRTVARLRNDLPRKAIAPDVTLPWLGDCIEGVNSQGGRLTMRLELTPTEQVRVFRRLLWAQIRAFAPHTERILIPVLPGNHDQAHRVGDQMATFHDDSWAIDGASAVMDGVNENPDLADRVRFVFPGHDELCVTLDVNGTTMGMTHGHVFGRDPLKWWDGQAGGRSPVGDADVLLAAHSHHLRVQDHGGNRLFMQIPALDGGSTWFRHRRGAAAPSRMVSFWTEGGRVRGLDPVL